MPKENTQAHNRSSVTHAAGLLRFQQLARALQARYDVVDRDCFYQAACNAQQEAVLGLERIRAIRLVERMAIMQAMVRFGLAELTRGGVPIE